MGRVEGRVHLPSMYEMLDLQTAVFMYPGSNSLRPARTIGSVRAPPACPQGACNSPWPSPPALICLRSVALMVPPSEIGIS